MNQRQYDKACDHLGLKSWQLLRGASDYGRVLGVLRSRGFDIGLFCSDGLWNVSLNHAERDYVAYGGPHKTLGTALFQAVMETR